MEPDGTALAALLGRQQLCPGSLSPDWLSRPGPRPVLAAPTFPRALYQALEDHEQNWLEPGLGRIPERDFFARPKINAGFPEAFRIGANDEIGRECLWCNSPADQRGTFFRRFWDIAENEFSPRSTASRPAPSAAMSAAAAP